MRIMGEWLPNTDPYLRGSATISDEEMVKAINKYRQENNTNIHGGKLPTSMVWVKTYQLSEHFNIHPHRISSKIRRMNKRKLTIGGGWDSRGDIVLKTAGESLLRGREYTVGWCGIKKTHYGHDYETRDGQTLQCMGYEVGFRSKPEPDEEFEWPDEDETEDIGRY